jgi:hypothetical protein
MWARHPTPHVGGWRREWGLLCLVALLALPLFTPRLYASDEIKYFVHLRSMYFDGDLQFANEYEHFIERDPVAHAGLVPFLEEVTATGHRLNDAPIGSALMWTPFYAVADLGVVVARWTGSSVARDGYSWPYVFAVCLASLFYGLAGLFLIYRLCREYANPGPAKTAVLGIWFATPVVFYLYITPPMAHATSLFTVTLFLFVWHQTRDDRRLIEWGLLAVSAGLMVLVRELNWLFLLVLVVDEIGGMWDALRRHRLHQGGPSGAAGSRWVDILGLRQRMSGYITFGIVLTIMVLPQFITYKVLHDTLGPSPFVVKKFSLIPWHAGEVLFSGFHGLFSWAPITLLGTLGLLALARRDGRLALALALVFATQVAVVGSYDTWPGGASFGARRFINCMPIFALGLAAAIDSVRPTAQRTAAVLVALLIVWNFGLAVQYATGIIPRDQPVTMRTIARNQFVEVPSKLADIAWRFLADRSSFYQTRS